MGNSQLDPEHLNEHARALRVAAGLEAAAERERRQIARELHDDLGQLLVAAHIRLSALCTDSREDVRRVAMEVSELLEQANRSARVLAARLSPAVLYELGLGPALEGLAEDLASSTGLDVMLSDDGAPKPLSQEVRAIAYRAVRELLINVARHARVGTACVELGREDGRVTVRVSDRGVGFDPAARRGGEGGEGLGLMSLAERLPFVGGTFEIRSRPGGGTEALLTLPLI